MKSILTLYTICCFVSCSFAQQVAQKVEIEFRKNMDLFGYLIQLGDPEDHDPEHPIMNILNQYTEDRSIAELGEIFELGAQIPYSVIVILLHELPDFPLEDNYEIPDSLLRYIGYTETAKQAKMRKLIRLLNQFAQASHFDQIWTELTPHRASLRTQVEVHRPSMDLIQEMEAFYQQEFEAYKIVPSLLIWSGPGWGFPSKDRQTAHFVLGPLDKNFDFSNGKRFEELAIHEFGHSFINHIVETKKNLPVIHKMDTLYAPLRTSMTRQGYGDWESCVIEHYVRAGEIIFKELLDDPVGKEALMHIYAVEREFIYLPFLIKRLKDYRLTKSLSYHEAVRQSLIDWQTTYANPLKNSKE